MNCTFLLPFNDSKANWEARLQRLEISIEGLVHRKHLPPMKILIALFEVLPEDYGARRKLGLTWLVLSKMWSLQVNELDLFVIVHIIIKRGNKK